MSNTKPAGGLDTAGARLEILTKLRRSLGRPDLRFPAFDPPPLTAETRMIVTRATGTLDDLAHRFGTELQTLHGTYEVAETATEARLALINRLMSWMEQEEKERKGAVVNTGQERSVLAWADAHLPIEGIGATLNDLGLKLIAPDNLRTPEAREKVRHIRYGVTGVAAAFASTGSMLMMAGKGTSRAASLLPFRHVALIPFSRLYPTMEHWLIEQREAGKLDQIYRERSNLAMISGPSKSADIEMNLTLGVHGPKFVHAILFDDSPPDDDDRFRPSDLFDDWERDDDDAGGFDAEDPARP